MAFDMMHQPGPCVICGDTNYSLSCGGSTICPKCDCGNFDAATVQKQAKVIAGLRDELERSRGLLTLMLHTEAMPDPAQDAVNAREATLKMVAGLFAESVHETYTREEIVNVVEDMIRLGRPSLVSSTPSEPAQASSEAREKEITRLATIAECAKLCDELRRKDYSAESADWTAGTLDCATAIRGLVVSSTQPSTPGDLGGGT